MTVVIGIVLVPVTDGGLVWFFGYEFGGVDGDSRFHNVFDEVEDAGVFTKRRGLVRQQTELK